MNKPIVTIEQLRRLLDNAPEEYGLKDVAKMCGYDAMINTADFDPTFDNEDFHNGNLDGEETLAIWTPEEIEGWTMVVTFISDDDGMAAALYVRTPEQAAITLNELQSTLGAWTTKTFPTRSQDSIIAHLRDEVLNELHPDCDPLELADVAMLTIDLANYRGLSLCELIRQKHKINLGRKWGEPNEQGFTEHIKEEQTP